ncbi:hypothetical protein [Paraburkholderia phenoliruptrix]|uniref:hypothetical protein n=1 Tax=Paraburkholderia phenoliruptrix TaxID=252970 RepID=UPI001C6E71E3|nr:hypothetical protein [Paraburkholderia phenoliruptrix]MBW9107770.1 hypothetical protein [Paraburkholderia phenoliruptrix]MBW9132988.1 hypothetical protein [Paraburkholderia ginsengiterrae]
MNIPALIEKALAAGVQLYVRNGKVKMRGPVEAQEALRPALAPHRDEIRAYLLAAEQQECDGALQSEDGGFYLPWGPYLTADNIRVLRVELVWIIEHLADLEAWPEEHREDVLTRAIRGPVSDLLPNIAHFKERLTEANAEAAARDAADKRTWRFDR